MFVWNASENSIAFYKEILTGVHKWGWLRSNPVLTKLVLDEGLGSDFIWKSQEKKQLQLLLSYSFFRNKAMEPPLSWVQWEMAKPAPTAWCRNRARLIACCLLIQSTALTEGKQRQVHGVSFSLGHLILICASTHHTARGHPRSGMVFFHSTSLPSLRLHTTLC